MKLLNCLDCHDVVALAHAPRDCFCGKSSGQYLRDKITVEYSGNARVLGMRNDQYIRSLRANLAFAHTTEYAWFVIPDGRNVRKVG